MADASVHNLENLDLEVPDQSSVNSSNRNLLPDGSSFDITDPESVERLNILNERKKMVLDLLNTTYLSEEGEEEEEEETECSIKENNLEINSA